MISTALWTRATFVPYYWIFILFIFATSGVAALFRVVDRANTEVSVGVACQVGDPQVTEHIKLPLICDAVETTIDDPKVVLKVITGHLTTITCTVYADKTARCNL